MKNNKPFILIVIGSKNDLEYVKEARELLKNFNCEYSLMISSAHRTPDRTREIIKNAHLKGVDIIIAMAGKASHLAGVIASYTTLPIIGVPLDSSLSGIDALLSTVQMPKGVPVASMGIGKSGAYNAIMFSLRILAISNKKIKDELTGFLLKEKTSLENEIKKYDENPI
jgi:phosphoribosylaminoimidazole carboxylase PurE protein